MEKSTTHRKNSGPTNFKMCAFPTSALALSRCPIPGCKAFAVSHVLKPISGVDSLLSCVAFCHEEFQPLLLVEHCKAFAQAADTKDPRQKVLHALPHGGGTLGMIEPFREFQMDTHSHERTAAMTGI